jgi:Galactose-3-O-sulfotransferase
VTERFDECPLLLRRKLGWASVLYRRENVAPAADRPPDPEAIAAIRERNRLDQDLYEHCARRVEKRVAAEGRSLERELRRFRVRNAVYGSLSASAARARARLGRQAA